MTIGNPVANLYGRLLDVSPNKLKKLGRDKLRELLGQCTEEQVNMFNKIYTSVDVIPLEKMDRAIDQVERTIVKNEENDKRWMICSCHISPPCSYCTDNVEE